MRGFTVSALITPNVLRVDTSLEGLAKFDLFSRLKIPREEPSGRGQSATYF
jgi:hypothetical protein